MFADITAPFISGLVDVAWAYLVGYAWSIRHPE